MDQFSAHLDRGWELVQRGDARGAELSARRALELDKDSPEAYNLLGYVAHLEGNVEDAVEQYRQALALDDGYLDAMLNAAEVYVYSLQELDEAIDLCEQALELADSDEVRVDALLLKFDALLAKDDHKAALALCARFPEPPYENPMHTFLVGRALFEVGDLARAEPLIEAATKVEPPNPDAAYYLGLVRDQQGDHVRATEAFLHARELDFGLPAPSWSLSRETFLMTARQAVAALPDEVKQHLIEGELYASDVPGVEMVVDGVDPRALLLLDGVEAEDGSVAARLFVYQRNVERLAGSIEEVESELASALERELRAMFEEQEAPPEQAEAPPEP